MHTFTTRLTAFALFAFIAIGGNIALASSACEEAYASSAPSTYPRVSLSQPWEFPRRDIKISVPSTTFSIRSGQSNRGILINFFVKTGNDPALFNLVRKILEDELLEFSIPDGARELPHLGFSYTLRLDDARAIDSRLERVAELVQSSVEESVEQSGMLRSKPSERAVKVEVILKSNLGNTSF